MAFTNSVTARGDHAVSEEIVKRTIAEFSDDTISYIGQRAFYKCSNLKTVNLPEVTVVDSYGFGECSTLPNITLEKAEHIGDSAFLNCEALASVNIPQAKKLGGSSFQGCKALTSIEFPLLESTSSSTFLGCTLLSDVTLPKVTSLGSSTFENCSSLTSANFPQVTSLGSSCFENCTGLANIDFPMLASVPYEGFYGCSLEHINLPMLTRIEGYGFYGNDEMVEADFPLVTSIGSDAFENCDMLQKIDFPMATTVGRESFASCGKLVEINLPITKTIEYRAFQYCSSLKRIELPSATNLGSETFEYCYKLERVDLPKATVINSECFYACYSLKTVILRENKVCTLGSSNAFNYCYHFSGTTNSTYNPNGDKDGFIYVPANLVPSYKAASGWSSWADNIRAIEDYPDICNPNKWEDVFASIDDGTYASKYSIGDSVEIDLGSEGILYMQIAAFDKDVMADGTGTAPISWIAKELLLTNQAMNPALVTNEDGTYQLGTGGIGGWRDSYIRSYLQETILPLIPEKVRNRIAVVSKTQDAYDESGAIVSQTTEDSLWSPDASELTGIYSALFPTQLSLKKTKPESDTYEDWWTRSVGANAPKAWTLVWADGMVHDNYGNMLTQYAEAIPLCFCTK